MKRRHGKGAIGLLLAGILCLLGLVASQSVARGDMMSDEEASSVYGGGWWEECVDAPDTQPGGGGPGGRCRDQYNLQQGCVSFYICTSVYGLPGTVCPATRSCVDNCENDWMTVKVCVDESFSICNLGMAIGNCGSAEKGTCQFARSAWQSWQCPEWVVFCTVTGCLTTGPTIQCPSGSVICE